MLLLPLTWLEQAADAHHLLGDDLETRRLAGAATQVGFKACFCSCQSKTLWTCVDNTFRPVICF